MLKINKSQEDYYLQLNTNIHYDKYVEYAYKNRRKINQQDTYGRTALHYICYHGFLDKFYALLNMGANINLLTNIGDNLLHYASYTGNDDYLIVELVKMGISPISLNKNLNTPIHYSKNSKIAHYFYLWCYRNNINIDNILNKNNMNLYFTSQLLNNDSTSNYWEKLVQYESNNNNNNLQKIIYYHLKKEELEFLSSLPKLK